MIATTMAKSLSAWTHCSPSQSLLQSFLGFEPASLGEEIKQVLDNTCCGVHGVIVKPTLHGEGVQRQERTVTLHPGAIKKCKLVEYYLLVLVAYICRLQHRGC